MQDPRPLPCCPVSRLAPGTAAGCVPCPLCLSFWPAGVKRRAGLEGGLCKDRRGCALSGLAQELVYKPLLGLPPKKTEPSHGRPGTQHSGHLVPEVKSASEWGRRTGPAVAQAARGQLTRSGQSLRTLVRFTELLWGLSLPKEEDSLSPNPTATYSFVVVIELPSVCLSFLIWRMGPVSPASLCNHRE